ncbi:unnamed protein product [Caenorhabditis bovis]|uniref:alpha-1,2-Mannosidase n=1 Tax=Caenorhabditis bovis TaxID=2654633 RepID=A0A8S1ELV9_9PELO|nr:unnamed protein product [Caenorhabditis bovis]
MLSKYLLTFNLLLLAAHGCEDLNIAALREEAHSMFLHGYKSYMNHAYPADELMPLSCKGRIRGVTPSRGDVDDTLGNFSLTLIDSLDTLVVLNEFDEFERAVNLVINNVKFDADLVVSVFETNIRVLGGLISAHIMALLVKEKFPQRLKKYDKQLLQMAVEVGDRLLPAFNTTSGLPYSRINLKFGMLESLKRQKDTCTACGGTMLLEMAALSRLSGNPIYELKARKAMDFLWQQRHRSSDLMGTVLNVHSGDWVRRESGIGAGIDSYYEYCLKAYILLGDSNYLERFNKHYDAVMRYVNKGPLFIDVHMHRPTVATRGFMDSLLAFWPGLQVLKGDVKEAIEMHEMLFQVIQKHKFLPEAFTHDFQVHWGEHPLRPEFVESTYFLYRATKDPHYLHVAKQIMDSINKYVKVPCGFASLKDVRTMKKEDQMESFVLSETFKYLYMIFSEPSDLIFDPDHYVLTTEAHFLPISMGSTENIQRKMVLRSDTKTDEFVCANPIDFTKLPTEREEAQLIREKTKMLLGELYHLQHDGNQIPGRSCETQNDRIRAWAFSATNKEHIKELAKMGVELVILDDGRLHLSHNAANAANPLMARWGTEFMQEMVALVAKLEKEETDRFIQILSYPHFGTNSYHASPAQFGIDLVKPLVAKVAIAFPFKACSPILNRNELNGKIAIVERTDCVFQTKAKNVQIAGAIGMIVIDYDLNSRYTEDKASFAMARNVDEHDDIAIPCLFVYRREGEIILNAFKRNTNSIVMMTTQNYSPAIFFEAFFRNGVGIRVIENPQCHHDDGHFVAFDTVTNVIIFNFRFGEIKPKTEREIDLLVEKHVEEFRKFCRFLDEFHTLKFNTILRIAAFKALNRKIDDFTHVEWLPEILASVILTEVPTSVHKALPGEITQVRCVPSQNKLICTTLAA